MNGVTLPAAGFAVPSEQTSLAAGIRRSGDFRRAASSITNNALADVGPSLLSGSAISDVVSRLGSATHSVTPLPYAIPMPADCGVVSAGAEAGVSLMQTMGGLPRSPGKVGASAASSHAADESLRRPSTAPSRDPGARHAAQAVASTMSPMLGELDSSWAVADSKEVEATLDDRLRKSMRLLGGSATRGGGESAPQAAFSPAEVSALRDILRRSAAAPSPAKSSSFSQSFARRSSAFEPRDAAEFAAAAPSSNSGALGVDFGATSADDPDYDAGDAYRGSRGPSAPQTPVRASTPVAREQPQQQQLAPWDVSEHPRRDAVAWELPTPAVADDARAMSARGKSLADVAPARRSLAPSRTLPPAPQLAMVPERAPESSSFHAAEILHSVVPEAPPPPPALNQSRGRDAPNYSQGGSAGGRTEDFFHSSSAAVDGRAAAVPRANRWDGVGAAVLRRSSVEGGAADSSSVSLPSAARSSTEQPVLSTSASFARASSGTGGGTRPMPALVPTSAPVDAHRHSSSSVVAPQSPRAADRSTHAAPLPLPPPKHLDAQPQFEPAHPLPRVAPRAEPARFEFSQQDFAASAQPTAWEVLLGRGGMSGSLPDNGSAADRATFARWSPVAVYRDSQPIRSVCWDPAHSALAIGTNSKTLLVAHAPAGLDAGTSDDAPLLGGLDSDSMSRLPLLSIDRAWPARASRHSLPRTRGRF